MKCNYGMVLALSALILMTGCKKSIKSSVDLAGGAKAGFATNSFWQMPSLTGRLIRYDLGVGINGDGLNSNCVLSYDVGDGYLTLTEFSDGVSTTLWSNSGFNTNLGVVPVSQWNTDITDNYNEVGGVHIIPFDYNGTGHEDHLLLYLPGHGLVVILHYIPASASWQVDYTNNSGNFDSGTGIGGYDLMGLTDKIIAYDYGSHIRNYLICYRPGYGFVWVMHSNASSSNPNPANVTWTDDIRSSGGIGGFDMEGVNDQLVCIGGPSNGSMSLAAYRPGYGYVWFIQHPANSTSFGGTYSTRSGLNGFGQDQQDRIVTLSDETLSNAAVVPEDDFNIFWYRPGSGTGGTAFYQWANPGGGLPAGPYLYSFTGTNSPLLLGKDPYPGGGAGDHVLCFSANGYGYNTSMLFYTPGAGKQSQLYYLGGDGSRGYYEAY